MFIISKFHDVAFLFVLLFLLCTPSKTVKVERDNSVKTNSEANIFGPVVISPNSFNPSQAESTVITLQFEKDASVSLKIIDEDGFVIRHIVSDSLLKAGVKTAFYWDGRDDSAQVVPDEAYFPLVILRSGETADTINPILLSGGEDCAVNDLQYNASEKMINYRIDQPSRIIARAGVQKGALFSTIVDMQPRNTGSVSEYWNGRDDDNLINVINLEQRSSVAVFGYKLPQPCIITYGNNNGIDYRSYRKMRDTLNQKCFIIPSDSLLGRSTTIHFRQPRVVDYAPRVDLTFLNNTQTDSAGAVVLNGKCVVRTTLNSEDIHFLDEQYEITFFIDGEFYTEEEVGYLPYNMVFDIADIPRGYHIFTVNVSSFKDRIGVKSTKILVQ